MRRKHGTLCIFIVSMLFWIISLGGAAIFPKVASGFFKMFPPFRIYEFALGMVLGHLYVTNPSSRHSTYISLGILGIVWIVFALIVQKRVIGFSSVGVYTIWTPGSAALVFALALSDFAHEAGIIGKLISFLSTQSFSFFMFHLVALRYTHAAMHVMGIEFSNQWGLIAGVAVFALNLAWATFWTAFVNPVLVCWFRSFDPFWVGSGKIHSE